VTAPSLPSLLVGHWRIAPALITVVGLYAGLYVWAGSRAARWPWRRTASFTAGLATVVVALQSGLDTDDDQLLTVHMVQHMLLLLVAPALLILGQPLLLALRALPADLRRALPPAPHRRRALRLTHPLAALAVLWTVILLTHLSGFYEATLRHPLLHDLEHAGYLSAGLVFWWPLLRGLPARRPPLDGVARLAYVIAAMPPMAAVGAYLNRSPTLAYPSYGPPARALGVDPLLNQAQAGAIMWVGGGLLLAGAGLAAAWQGLVEEERRQRVRDRRLAT
jgi:putative copper resistance protein D